MKFETEYNHDLKNMEKNCIRGEELEVYLSKIKRITKIEEKKHISKYAICG